MAGLYTLAELGLILHFHGGIGVPVDKADSPAAMTVGSIETAWWNYRPLWYLMFGGVFERHPELKVVFTEGSASWVPSIVDEMDVRYEDEWMVFKDLIANPPSFYWGRQCHVGASFMSRAEVELRDLIGGQNMMFGSDYPHVEGTWPQTASFLHEALSGCSEEVARALCAENSARLYGFDLDYLDGVAAGVGPTTSSVIDGSPSPASAGATDRIVARANRPASWVMAGVPRGFTRVRG